MSDAHAELIEHFYRALQRRDAEAMCACYHPQVRFSDPLFADLRGEAAGDMWRMLCSRAQDFSLSYGQVQADSQRGSAQWQARYTFSQTGRSVLNRIQAEFEFGDGLILVHRDQFDLWRWARQALGARGWLLGALPPVQRAIAAQAARSLTAWRAARQG